MDHGNRVTNMGTLRVARESRTDLLVLAPSQGFVWKSSELNHERNFPLWFRHMGPGTMDGYTLGTLEADATSRAARGHACARTAEGWRPYDVHLATVWDRL